MKPNFWCFLVWIAFWIFLTVLVISETLGVVLWIFAVVIWDLLWMLECKFVCKILIGICFISSLVVRSSLTKFLKFILAFFFDKSGGNPPASLKKAKFLISWISSSLVSIYGTEVKVFIEKKNMNTFLRYWQTTLRQYERCYLWKFLILWKLLSIGCYLFIFIFSILARMEL